jgi:FKBP-type peptidyl-prolyl cis-trans isomerase 2
MMQFLKAWILTATVIGLLATQWLLVRAESNPPVAEGAVVLIEFTITVPESRMIIPNNVSQFVPGQHEVLPNLERALTGMKKGEEKRVDLSSDEAFGPYDESKRGVVSKDRLPADTKPGTVLETEDGVPFVVVEISGPLAAVDFNHPLAGKHLVIDVKILNVELPEDEQGLQLGDRNPDRELSI